MSDPLTRSLLLICVVSNSLFILTFLNVAQYSDIVLAQAVEYLVLVSANFKWEHLYFTPPAEPRSLHFTRLLSFYKSLFYSFLKSLFFRPRRLHYIRLWSFYKSRQTWHLSDRETFSKLPHKCPSQYNISFRIKTWAFWKRNWVTKQMWSVLAFQKCF